jgi:hypothetical protein
MEIVITWERVLLVDWGLKSSVHPALNLQDENKLLAKDRKKKMSRPGK